MAYNSIALFSFIFVLIADILIRINSFIGESNGSTEIVALAHLVTVVCLLILTKKFNWNGKLPYNGILAFKLFMVWSLFALIHGAYNAHDYWDWKALLMNYSFSILVPFAIVLGLNFEVSFKVFRFILDKLSIYGFVFVPVALAIDNELYPRIVAAVSLLILFVPYLKFRWRVLIFIVAAVSISMDFSYRTNAMRILFSVGLLLLFFNRHLIKAKLLNFVLGLMLVLPLMFLYLGASGKFNVFEENPFDVEVITGSYTETDIANLSSDTRTFLYQEVTRSMLKRDSSFIYGEGGGSGYETAFFLDYTLNDRGRYGSEVGFLNTLLYAGFIGVLLYALMLFLPAYYAINRSNNYLCKMLGLYLAFHWVLFFVEDIVRLDINFFFIWLTIGLCLSNKFREMTDRQIVQLFKFEVKRPLVIVNRKLQRNKIKLAAQNEIINVRN